MSASIVRKALSLSEENIKKGGKKKAPKDIPTNKWGYRKNLRKLQAKSRFNTGKATVKDKKIKSAIEEYKKKEPVDHTEDNIYFLKKLSERKVQSSVVEKVFNHPKNDKPLKIEEEKAESTLFTDDDFKKWEKQFKS